MDEERRGTWFGFGFCGFGQALGSGLGRQVHSPEPLRTPGGSLHGCRVSASWSYTAFVTQTGDIYIWGWNESGQLALPTKSLAEDGKTTAEGEASGLEEDGSEVKRGSAGEDGAPAPFIAVQPFPALLDLSPGSEAVKVSCGSRHTAVLTSKYGQLGHKDTTTLDRPCRVEYFVDKQLQVRTVSCGPWNTYVYAVEKEKS
ncbi:hypothetical protein E5288_WYG022785 [Bos mutus]|uniref:RCC1 domain-containing protein 1 n=1 Tax=Bos mutus TaxID=72004 RepID=A0A6B0QZZ2_9CETA|nr:hypothetical protein [Bos mutus]